MTTKTNHPQQERNKDFGLPQGEFKPIESVGSKWLKITSSMVGLILSVGAGIVYWFFYHVPSDKPSKKAYTIHEKYESESPKTDAGKDVSIIDPSTEKDKQPYMLYQEAEIKDETEKKGLNTSHATSLPKEGTVTRISKRKGYYYIIVGSFIDDDLASDYANQLAKKGIHSMLLTPLKGQHFFRVAIERKDSFKEANKKAAVLRAEYGSDIWVTRY